METNWKEVEEERERLFEKRLTEAKKNSSAAKVFFNAVELARRQAKDNGILPIHDQHGEFKYNVKQGLKAACHAREDISATLQIQYAVLQRLDRNRNLLWVVIALLAYLAYRIT
jgi:hypothetical protein